MASFPVDAVICASACAAAFAVSLFKAAGARFEAPIVFYSIAFFGRLAGTAAAFAYPPATGTLLPLLPDGDLGFLLFYPILVGALRFAARAYAEKGGRAPEARRILLAALPLLVVDVARLVWLVSKMPIPFLAGARFPAFPAVPPGVWGAVTAAGIAGLITFMATAQRSRT